jgi:hypothetical protein
MIKSTHLAQALAEEFLNAEDETEASFFISSFFSFSLFCFSFFFLYPMHSQMIAKT